MLQSDVLCDMIMGRKGRTEGRYGLRPFIRMSQADIAQACLYRWVSAQGGRLCHAFWEDV